MATMSQATGYETERDEIVERAAEAGERAGHRHDGLHPFLQRYYRHVPVEDLAEREPLDLAGAALSHKQLASRRPQGTANVRVFTPTVDEYGWTSGHTVVEIVTDDMPFLVDSVTAELSRQERGIHLLVHPQVVVRRDVTGTLLERLEVGATDWARQDHPPTASWSRGSTSRSTARPTAAHLEEILPACRSVLEDVRVAVEDWPKMQQRAREIAAELTSSPPAGPPPRRSPRGGALLSGSPTTTSPSWATASTGSSSATAGRPRRRAPASGLGILRYDQHHGSPSFDRLTPAGAREGPREAAAGADEGQHPRHRPPAGLPRLRRHQDSSTPTARSSGSAASSGCSPPAPTPTACAASPSSAARCRRCSTAPASAPTATRARTCCRSSRPTRATSSSRSPSRTCRRSSSPCCTCRSAAGPGCSCGVDDYGRYMSCLVYLPRDRYTTSVRLRMEADPAGGLRGQHRRLHRPGHRERAGPPALRRPRAARARRCRTSTATALEAASSRPPAPGTRTSPMRCGPTSARRRAPGCCARGATASPRRTRRTSRPGSPSPTCAGSRRWTAAAPAPPGTDALGMNLYEPVGAARDERRFKVYRRAPLSLTDVLPS